MTIPVPTLSPQGFVTDISGKADALLSHFYESMYSQTFLYGKNISSLQYIIQQYGDDVNKLCTQLQNTLEKYLGRYYDLAIVTIGSNVNDPNDTTNQISLTIHCSLTENGTTYSIGDLLKISNSKVTSVTRVNN